MMRRLMIVIGACVLAGCANAADKPADPPTFTLTAEQAQVVATWASMAREAAVKQYTAADSVLSDLRRQDQAIKDKTEPAH